MLDFTSKSTIDFLEWHVLIQAIMNLRHAYYGLYIVAYSIIYSD